MMSVCFQFPLSNYFFEIVMTVTDFPKTRITVKILLDNKIFGILLILYSKLRVKAIFWELTVANQRVSNAVFSVSSYILTSVRYVLRNCLLRRVVVSFKGGI